MLKYSLVSTGDAGNITLVVDGEMYVASSDHPNYKAIVAGALAGDEKVADLFDVAQTVITRFQELGERVTVSNGHLFFDGDRVENALSKQILRFVQEGVADYKPLVNFMQKVATNPNEHSREQLYSWLNEHDFTIDDDGDIIAYKGVTTLGDGQGYQSCTRGTAIVDGVVVTGHIPNPVGSVVTMPRSEVAHDPATGCSTGLHVATYSFAKSFGNVVLIVKVNPRDVVSVPTECNWQKMRVCRYEVVDVVDGEIDSAYYASYSDEDEYDDIYDDVPVTVTTNDTRQNHLRQKRIPAGQPGAGRFIKS